MTNLTPNLPSDYMKRDGFPMAAVLIKLYPKGSIKVSVSRHRVRCGTDDAPNSGFLQLIGAGYCFYSDVYKGKETRKSIFSPECGQLQDHLFCAEGDIDECIEYLIKQVQGRYKRDIAARRSQLQSWEECDISRESVVVSRIEQ